jgi:hypothetical protein
MSAEKAAARDQPRMTNPHSVPGPAGPFAPDGHGAPGGAGGGVPVSIWPGLPAAPARHSTWPCAGPVTVQAAARIVDAFSRPGDLVAAVDGSPMVIEAAAAARRLVLGLLPGPVRDGRALAGLRTRLGPAAWPFARLRPGGPDLLLAPGDPDAGQATLAVVGCHGPGCPGPELGSAPGPGPGLLHAACARVLAPGGILAVVTSPATSGKLTDLAGYAVATARAAGLIYAQHIVLVHAAIDGDQLAPGPRAAGAAAQPGGRRVHSDLLVFTKPGGITQHD